MILSISAGFSRCYRSAVTSCLVNCRQLHPLSSSSSKHFDDLPLRCFLLSILQSSSNITNLIFFSTIADSLLLVTASLCDVLECSFPRVCTLQAELRPKRVQFSLLTTSEFFKKIVDQFMHH